MASMVGTYRGEKRKRHQSNSEQHRDPSSRQRHSSSQTGRQQESKAWNRSDQARINQLQEEERHREYLAQEGGFILKQKRKAAEIRVREGRAKPIDWLTIILRIVDPTEDLINDEEEQEDLDLVAPESVFDNLTVTEMQLLERDIQEMLNLEQNPKSRDYWKTMRILCKDKRRKFGPQGPEGRVVSSVSSDIDRLLGPKTYEELEKLEKQITTKLDSDEPIDTDYWHQLLDSLLVWKAKARVKKVYQAVADAKLSRLKQENEKLAIKARQAFPFDADDDAASRWTHDTIPLLQVDLKDKTLGIVDEEEFLNKVAADRRRILEAGYTPLPAERNREKRPKSHPEQLSNSGGMLADSQNKTSSFEREAAKGMEEDEEVFAGEEEVEIKNKDSWTGNGRPRKPKYFNRVQMGYEWNKYNQTHYDHDNPPPKVVQGYKFHIFYPELIDKYKAPTYKIMRDDGRKKGQTLAPAGEEDTCIIRFMSGPPYEDVAFRIVDRDWDYSAKHDRGFKSTFENGVLTLHFSFKKVYYRK